MPNEGRGAPRSKRGGQRQRRGRGGAPKLQQPASNGEATEPERVVSTPVEEGNKEDDLDEELCHICAEPMEKKYYAVAQCNHRVCHQCAIRLRALYKKMECTFCKSPQPVLIITASAERLFENFGPEDTPYHDMKLAIEFETQEMMEECLILLKYNCPDDTCTFVASGGFPELKHHTRTTHGLLLCNLCLRHKKIFAHEHTLYKKEQLSIHLPTARAFASKHASSSTPNADLDVHPVCQFCDEALYSEEEHFKHMRSLHEECFVCKSIGIRHQYFKDYDSLERHFQSDHNPCPHPECIAQKFVVFATPLDLKAHVLETHGETLSSRDMRDVRRIQTEFVNPEPARNNIRQGRGGERQPGASSNPPAPSAATRRQQAFSGNLSHNDSASDLRAANSATPVAQVANITQTPQETALFSRLSAATHGSSAAIPAVKAAIQAFRSGESSARSLLDTLFNVLGQEVDATNPFIPLLVNVIDNEEKGQDITAAWNQIKYEQEQQFPSLVPSQPTPQLQPSNQRTLKVKKAQGGGARRQVWDRVAQAASSNSTAGPPLPRAPASRTFNSPAPMSSTPWSRSGATASSSRTPAERPKASSSSSKKPAPPSLTAFPSLPTSNVSRPPKEFISGQSSLRAIVGAPSNANAWSSSGTSTPVVEAVADSDDGAQPKQQKKKAAKQTLFTLGSMR